MAAGIPGVGIGGLFYVLGAVAAPLRELARRARGSTRDPLWAQAFRLCGMACGIVVAMWLTGLVLGALLQATSAAIRPGSRTAGLGSTSSVWRVSALALSLGTLTLVLGIVQLARLWSRHARGRAAARLERALLMVLLMSSGAVLSLATPRRTGAQQAATVAVLRTRAESIYARGDRPASDSAYVALLAASPDDPRALFRLAGLRGEHPDRMIPLLERYVRLEAGDAWGWMALADAYSRDGRHGRATSALDRASRVAPGERDVLFARARVMQREGRTDATIRLYETLVATGPRDADAWQALAVARRRAGRPRQAIEALEAAQRLQPTPRRLEQIRSWRQEAAVQFDPAGGFTRDSDANVTQRAGLTVRLPLVGRAAITGGASVLRATNAVDYGDQSVSTQSAVIGALVRPRAALSIETTAGAVQVRAVPLATGGSVPTTFTTPVGTARVRWRSSASGPSIDVRATRVLIDATPLLIANRVVRTEGSLSLDVPLLAGFRARATGRRGYINSADEPENTRTLAGASLVRPLRGWGDVAFNAQRISVGRPTSQGYFAPRDAQIAELSTYLERERDNGVLLAVDAGFGMQRMRTFEAAALSSWQPAARLWSHLDVPLERRVMLRAELDVYDGGVAREAAAAAHWRWISASLGVRLTP